MARARVVVQKVGTKSLETDIREFILPLSDRQLFQLSEETVKEIKNKIAESLQRPGSTGHLASAFFAEKIAKGYGIGNIDYLNQNAKSWYWLEHGIAQSGRKIPPITTGFFAPGQAEPMQSEFRTGRFEYTGDYAHAYLLNPKRAIEPHNYISKTIARISEIANIVLSTVK